MKETESKSAMGLIINPQSGEILAMSSVPSFDNNNFLTILYKSASLQSFDRPIRAGVNIQNCSCHSILS